MFVLHAPERGGISKSWIFARCYGVGAVVKQHKISHRLLIFGKYRFYILLFICDIVGNLKIRAGDRCLAEPRRRIESGDRRDHAVGTVDAPGVRTEEVIVHSLACGYDHSFGTAVIALVAGTAGYREYKQYESQNQK